MSDLETAASLATAGGTLVLAIATFASIRSANRSARTAERQFLASLRPVLMPARQGSPPEKIAWMGSHWAKLSGNQGHAVEEDGVLYLAMALRNVGTGIGVLIGWRPVMSWEPGDEVSVDLSEFRMQSRDLYVAPGDTGYWQAAVREAADPQREPISAAIRDGERITVDLLYGDHEGGQRTVSRFSLNAVPDSDEWFTQHSRHVYLDAPSPR